MANKYITLDSSPVNGGALMARPSAEKAGILNYTLKRDFRRDLDEERRGEGHDYFHGNTGKDIVTLNGEGAMTDGQPFPNGTIDGEPITLIFNAKRPNGQQAIIAATPTKIWRYFSLEDGRYALGNENGIYVNGDVNGSYWDENPGSWLLIGSGFVPVGPEFLQVHSGLINVTQVAASFTVTSSAAFFTAFMVGKQIRVDGGHIALITGYTSPTQITVDKSATVNYGPQKFRIITGAHRWEAVTINGYTIFNNGADLPQVYRLEWTAVRPMYELRESGIARVGTIASYNGILTLHDITEIHSDKLLENFSLQDSGFITASQAGSAYSGLVTISQAAASTSVVSTSPGIFTAGMVGKYIRYTNGFKSLITVFTDAEHITVANAITSAVSGLPFWIIDENDASPTYSKLVNSSSPIFLPEMVGMNIVWDSGAVRKIVSYVSTTQVKVDGDLTIASGVFGVERRFAYDPYVYHYVNRFQYRVMWSLPGEPTRFGPTYKGTIGAGTYQLVLQYPQKSLAIGQEILVIGAGTAGGNLQAKIVYISSLGQVLWLDTLAETAVTGADVLSADTVGTILGFEDLQDDGSGILRAIQLKNVLVILKDTSFFIARYTGLVDTPFDFGEPVPSTNHKTIHYRWTLATVDSEWLVYAGRNAFFRFDLTNQIPLEIKEFDLCSNIFFDQAILDNTNSIFVADNAITKQLMFVFPPSSEEKGLLYDYKWKTMSTSSMLITAAATVKRPQSALAVGETEDWFVMGTAQGVVLLYGKVDRALGQWSNSKEIYYRRSAAPYSVTRSDYSCILQSGLSHFGDQNTEKDVQEFLLYLASQMANGPVPTIFFELFGTRNLAELKTLLLSYQVPNPESENLIPFYFRQHYFQSRITASGLDRDCRISGWAWRVAGVKSGSNIRRV